MVLALGHMERLGFGPYRGGGAVINPPHEASLTRLVLSSSGLINGQPKLGVSKEKKENDSRADHTR
jgi:hypothetical protein